MEYLERDRAGSAQRLADAELREELATTGSHVLAWLPAAIAVIVLVAWELAARLGWISTLFFPPPSVIAGSVIQLTADGVLLQSTATTVTRLGLGLLIGGSAGLLLGFAMGMSRSLRLVVEPFISAAHPIPKIAIFPLILIMFGVGEASRVAVTALAAFFPMLINTMVGVSQIHPIYFEVAENYGAGRVRTFARVVLPGSLPSVLAGLLLALNITLLLTIAVEMVGARDGLGATIWFSWQTMRTEQLYASLLVIVLLGIGFNFLFRTLMRSLVRWQPERES